jgi:hypothetical protein
VKCEQQDVVEIADAEREALIAGIRFDPQIKFKMETQRGGFLCWIAVAVSARNHLEPTAPPLLQCTLAEALLRPTSTCCTAVALGGGYVPLKCNVTGALDAALGATPGVGHLQATASGAMKFADIQTEIDKGLPVCAFISWTGDETDDGHFILISGYHVSRGVNYLYVKDSKFHDGVHSYNTVVSHYRLKGTWMYTYTLKG